MKTQKAAFVRASISFPTEIYQSLETLAKNKKVSLAWVVREAAERYVTEQTKRDRHTDKGPEPDVSPST